MYFTKAEDEEKTKVVEKKKNKYGNDNTETKTMIKENAGSF